MIRETVAQYLEGVGYRRLAADELTGVAPQVSLVLERHDLPGGPADVLVVVDRTDPDALPDAADGPHRSARGLPAFSLSLADLQRFAEQLKLRRTFTNPLRRVTVLELGDGPLSAADEARLAAYRTPARGTTYVGALYVDAAARTVWSNDEAHSSGLPHCEDPARIVAQAAGGSVIERPFLIAPALFGPKAIAFTSFWGSPFAGALLLAWNLHKTRRTKVGLAIVAATAVVLAVVIALPTGQHAGLAVGMVVNFGFMFLFSTITGKLFGDPLRKPSVGYPILVTLISWVLLFGGSIGGAMMWEAATVTTVQTAGGAAVLVERGASPEEAKALGVALETHKVLGPGSDVRFAKTGEGRVLSLALAEERAYKKPEIRSFYQSLASTLSTDLFHGEPFEIVFLDKWGERADSVASNGKP